MKKQILDALKAKFEGVSEAILNRIADKLSKTVTSAEGVTAAVEGVTIQQVIESYGDSRATEAQATAVHNYESKYGLKDGKKVDAVISTGGTHKQPDEKNGGGDATPAWAQALIASNQKLTERLNNIEVERATTARKKQLSEVIGKLPENLRKPYERMAISDLKDEEFNSLVEEVTTEVDNIVTGLQAKGAVFGKPQVHGGSGSGQALTKEQEAAIAHRDGVPAKDQQPF